MLRSRGLATAACAAVVLGLTAGLADVAQAAGQGHITGTVTSTSAATLADVDVEAFRLDDGEYIYETDTTTESNGTYDLELDPGTYRIVFDAGQDYELEYFNDKATLEEGTDLVVAANGMLPGKDAVLAAGSHVKGQVTRAVDGAPLEDTDVAAYIETPSGEWEYTRDAYTDSSGNYDLSGLKAGTYRLEFDCYLFDLETSDDFTVGSQATVDGKNAALSPVAQIKGHVTGPAGQPVEDVDVYALDAAGDLAGLDTTDSSGNYDVSYLDPGSYRLKFVPPPGALVDEYYNNSATLTNATVLTVAAHQLITGINAQLGTTPPGTPTPTPPPPSAQPPTGQRAAALAKCKKKHGAKKKKCKKRAKALPL